LTKEDTRSRCADELTALSEVIERWAKRADQFVSFVGRQADFVVDVHPRLQGLAEPLANLELGVNHTFLLQRFSEVLEPLAALQILEQRETAHDASPCAADDGQVEAGFKLRRERLHGKLQATAEEFASAARELARSLGADITTPAQHFRETKHSADFSTVNWGGTRYLFNPTQALCVECLWAEWLKGGLGLHEATIGDAVGSADGNFRLQKRFRSKDGRVHAAWGTMIRSVGNGVFVLEQGPAMTDSTESDGIPE